MEWNEYLPVLRRLINENSHQIDKDLMQFVNSKKIYRNISYNNSLSLILIKKNLSETTLNIGYPFPMLSKKIKNYKDMTKKGISIGFFLKGESIRTKQRLTLFYELCKEEAVKVIDIKNMDNFRDLTKKICNEYTTFDYFDPYTFVGDSFIGLYFIDNFKDKFKLKLNKIYSTSYKHLSFAFNSHKFNPNKIDSCKGLCIVGDFIDIHWNMTLPLIKQLLKKNKTIVLLGRNIILKKDKESIKIYHLALEDHLLRNQNIEDYMRSVVKPYLISKEFPKKMKPLDELNILINPFGSEEIKTIPVDFVVSFIKELSKLYPNLKIILVKGLNFLEHHKKWINKIKVDLEKERLNSKISMKSYDSLSEIAQDITINKVCIGLTSDTSISHLLNFMGIINLSFFNSDRWDAESIQSLSSDSPLGFCRYYPTEIPIIFNHKNYFVLLEDIINLIRIVKGRKIKFDTKRLNFLIAKLCNKKDLKKINNSIKKFYLDELNKKNLIWADNLFNPVKILKKINLDDNSKYLFYSAWRLNLLNKLGGLK
ncbi:MAG: hypothetical protein AABW67_04655 [Nanoarchaeota archaeon]